MRCHRFSSSPPLPLYLFSVLVMVAIPVSLSTPELYGNCSNSVFKCGKFTAGYPFYGGDRQEPCGHRGLQLYCNNETTIIEILGVGYQVLEIYWDHQILRIARDDLITNGFCGPDSAYPYSNLDSNLFELVNAPGLGYPNITLFYDCQHSFGFFSCGETGEPGFSTYKNVSMMIGNTPPEKCSANVTVPVLQTSLEGIRNSSLGLEEALKTGFEVKWKLEDREACRKCNYTTGTCGFYGGDQPVCYCSFPIPNWEEAEDCSPPPSAGSISKINMKWKITIGIAGTIAISVVFSYLIFIWKKMLREKQNVKEFIEKYGSLAPKRYRYSDVKKMTKTFKHKLGQGGFGSVYRGKLLDGQRIAVKILSESKAHGEEFLNEVASISRTSHVNIVTLLGFCYESSKRALIYEYMPYGSLDRFIFDKSRLNMRSNFEWRILYQITIGIARGLEYLHQGCKTRILHFDIKPHNILLDEEFRPKISDFRTC